MSLKHEFEKKVKSGGRRDMGDGHKYINNSEG